MKKPTNTTRKTPITIKNETCPLFLISLYLFDDMVIMFIFYLQNSAHIFPPYQLYFLFSFLMQEYLSQQLPILPLNPHQNSHEPAYPASLPFSSKAYLYIFP